jgi:amidase
MAAKSRWEDIAAAKRRAVSIPNDWIIPDAVKPPESQLDVTDFPEKSGFFTNQDLEITSKSATELLQKLHSGEWTSLAVTSAFCKRAAVAQQLVARSKPPRSTAVANAICS